MTNDDVSHTFLLFFLEILNSKIRYKSALLITIRCIEKKSEFLNKFALFLFCLNGYSSKIRAPPIFFFQNNERRNWMKNDYKKYQFWVKKINNKKIWYIRIKNQWVEVDKEVYAVCTNSYQKMNYEIKKDKNNSNYSDINNIDLYGHYFEVDYIDVIYQEDLKKRYIQYYKN